MDFMAVGAAVIEFYFLFMRASKAYAGAPRSNASRRGLDNQQ
jgi:hypothetical protein